MNRYSYKGPVLEYGRLLADDFTAETYAVSAAKAKSNIAYQFKKQTGRGASSKITLTGKVMIKEDS